MEEKKKYRFADEKEQLKRVNSFLATGYTIFYIVILSVSWESYFRGVRTLGYTGLLSVLTLIAMAINFLSTRKDKSQSRSRKIAFICFVVIAFLMAYAYDSYYVMIYCGNSVCWLGTAVRQEKCCRYGRYLFCIKCICQYYQNRCTARISERSGN